MKSRPTVLLVEDDPDLTRFADLALRLGGYRAVTAGDGASAVRAAQQVRPDVVVLDLRLPCLDGWQVLAARLRAGDPPVVARLERDRLLLDPRTILPEEDALLLDALRAALGPADAA